jgi:hypothetical protein
MANELLVADIPIALADVKTYSREESERAKEVPIPLERARSPPDGGLVSLLSLFRT